MKMRRVHKVPFKITKSVNRHITQFFRQKYEDLNQRFENYRRTFLADKIR